MYFQYGWLGIMQHFLVLRNGHVVQYFELPPITLVRIALLPSFEVIDKRISCFSAIDSYFNFSPLQEGVQSLSYDKADVIAARYSGGRQYHNDDTIALFRDTWDVYTED
jgi:hypothetical protein